MNERIMSEKMLGLIEELKYGSVYRYMKNEGREMTNEELHEVIRALIWDIDYFMDETTQEKMWDKVSETLQDFYE